MQNLSRGSGILLPISSLPGPYGIGDIGASADLFINFLKNSRITHWQILPLTPTTQISGNSPYSPTSVFAGNPLYIDLAQLTSQGLLRPDWHYEDATYTQTDYQTAQTLKTKALRSSFQNFTPTQNFLDYCLQESFWLDDYSLFTAIKETNNDLHWLQWPDPLKYRDPQAIQQETKRLQNEITYIKFCQYTLSTQMNLFRQKLKNADITLIGDLPIYVTLDSSDVWANPQLFQLDQNLTPTFIAGVPPDYFNEEGQLWENPLYNWEEHQKTNYLWWISRLRQGLKFYDLLRIDHFRGLVAYWSIPSNDHTAKNGVWQHAPTQTLFDAIKLNFPNLPFLAENLGHITPDVIQAMDYLGVPGMTVLQFAFKEVGQNSNAPHNHTKNSVTYTGTHDNDTTTGWYQSNPQEAKTFSLYANGQETTPNPAWWLIKLAYSSISDLAIIPIQDWLAQGTTSRMNTPGAPKGNWTYRLDNTMITEELSQKIKSIATLYGRTSPSQ